MVTALAIDPRLSIAATTREDKLGSEQPDAAARGRNAAAASSLRHASTARSTRREAAHFTRLADRGGEEREGLDHGWSGAMGAGVGASSDIAPGMTPNAVVFVSLGSGRQFRARLTAGYADSSELDLGESLARFRLGFGRAELCPLAVFADPVALRPCAAFEVGMLHAEGLESPRIAQSKTSFEPWTAGLATLRAEVGLGSAFSFVARGPTPRSLLAPYVRSRAARSSGVRNAQGWRRNSGGGGGQLSMSPRALADRRHAPIDADERADGSKSGAFSRFARAEATPTAAERSDALVRANLRLVWRLLRRLGLSPSDADDATQRVFFVAVQRIDRIEIGSERAFVCRTAVRIAYKIHATAKRRRESEGAEALDALADSAPSAEELSERNRAREVLDRVLEAMPIELRAVFVLFEVERMSTTEIAETLGIPRGTAASRLRRARADFDQRVHRLEARMKFREGAG